MDELIKVTEAGSINARDLWEYLESKQQFADWIKNRIEEYGFIEGSDFSFQKTTKVNPRHKRGTKGGNIITEKEYYITLDMAKHLAMVEKSVKGRAIRQYFIDVEENLRKYFRDRKKSKDVRGSFTDVLQSSGICLPLDYASLTLTTKKELYIPLNKPKDSYNKQELLGTMLAEIKSTIALERIPRKGYEVCKKVIEVSSRGACREVWPDIDFDSPPPLYIEDTNLSKRENLSRLIHLVSGVRHEQTKEVWNTLWLNLYGSVVYGRAKRKHLSVIEYIEEQGDIGRAYDYAVKMYSDIIYRKQIS